FGPELVQETTDKVVLIKEKLKAVRDRQKNYTDNRRKPLEFEVGNLVLLKVSLWKGVIRSERKCARYISCAKSEKYVANANPHVPLEAIKDGDTKVHLGLKREFMKVSRLDPLYRRQCVMMISILVTPRVSALTGCDRLVSEPLVIENFISIYGLLDIKISKRRANVGGTEGGRVVRGVTGRGRLRSLVECS
ncbi:hypothetical protein Tco_0956388, partial [Tanacetum coccineum]